MGTGFLIYLGNPTVLSMVYELRLVALRPFLLESLPFQMIFIFVIYSIGILTKNFSNILGFK